MLACGVRTTVIYLVLIGAVRLMGKRQLGQLEASEFVVTMLAANLAALPIEDPEFPMSHGILAIVVLLGMERMLSLAAMRSLWFRKVLCGKPVILIENGKILRENLRRTRIHMDELAEHLRQKDVLDLKSVQFAILETDGSLSVFPYPGERPASAKEAGIQTRPQYIPITIVSDGKLLKENLSVAGKDRTWVERVLGQRGVEIENTLLLTVDKADKIVFYPKWE